VRIALLLVLVACRDEPAEERDQRDQRDSVPPPRSGPPDVIAGTIVEGGVAVTPTACRVVRETVLVVEAVTPRGTLRFSNAQLVWKGSVLACTKLDRSWGGGSRTDGTHYWRGMLDFVCGPVTEASEAVRPSRARDGMITGKLELDCGGITPTERAQLDANREKSRQPQD
jgi:hypothetical protein